MEFKASMLCVCVWGGLKYTDTTPEHNTQETHDQSLKCGEELQNQCLF